MRNEIFALAITHFHNLCKPFITDTHSDKRKEDFKKKLFKLSEIYCNIDLSLLSDTDLSVLDSNLKFFFNWAIVLDCKNGYTLSSEMRMVLNDLCEIWIDNSDKYFFAPSDGAFAIKRYSPTWDVEFATIKKMYGIDFTHQLVPIYVPKHLSNDFLFNATLYHEFGHFVVFYYNMYDIPTQTIIALIEKDEAEGKDIRGRWFKRIDYLYDNNNVCSDKKKRDVIIENYVNEYMADLFGAQYVGDNISNHRESNRHGTEDEDSDSHPSYNQRHALVEDFLNGVSDNLLLNIIIDEFNQLKNPDRTLTVKYVKFSDNELHLGKSISLSNRIELHSLIFNAWKVYIENAEQKLDSSGNKLPQRTDVDLYSRVNSAVQLSIQEFFNP